MENWQKKKKTNDWGTAMGAATVGSFGTHPGSQREAAVSGAQISEGCMALIKMNAHLK